MKTTTARFLDEVERGFADRPARPSRIVLVSRLDAPTRRLVNEGALAEALADLGVESVQMGKLGFAGQLALMRNTRLLIGVHGAGLTNHIFCPPGAGLIEISSTQYIRRSRSYSDLAMYRRLPYALAIADQHGENWVVSSNRGNDLELSPAAIGRIRDLALRMLAGQAAPATAAPPRIPAGFPAGQA